MDEFKDRVNKYVDNHQKIARKRETIEDEMLVRAWV